MFFTSKITVSLFAVYVFNSPTVHYTTDLSVLEYMGRTVFRVSAVCITILSFLF